MYKSSNKIVARNQKVALKRGDKWKLNLKKGWLESQMSPTKLKITRVSKGFSQTTLAEKAKLSLSTYGGIERGKRPASKIAAKTLSESLGVPSTQIFKENSSGKFIALS